MKRVIMIHGWGAEPMQGWRPWLKKQLESKDFFVDIPEMPEPATPQMDQWVGHMHSVVGMPDKDTILVGHSLGCIAILRYLETVMGDVKIGGAVLVAGPGMDLDISELKSFFESGINFAKVKQHCTKFILINSDDDYYIPLEHGKFLEKNLGAELIIKEGHRHFSSADGFTQLPVALESVLKLAKS